MAPASGPLLVHRVAEGGREQPTLLRPDQLRRAPPEEVLDVRPEVLAPKSVALVHALSLHVASISKIRAMRASPSRATVLRASAADVQLLGDRPGQRTAKRVRPVRLVEPAGPRLVAEHEGVNVHAETCVDGRDRRRLERLCRYVARPPVATERLSLVPDGRVRLAFEAAWRDGIDAVILAPLAHTPSDWASRDSARSCRRRASTSCATPARSPPALPAAARSCRAVRRARRPRSRRSSTTPTCRLQALDDPMRVSFP